MRIRAGVGAGSGTNPRQSHFTHWFVAQDRVEGLAWCVAF